MSPRSFLTSILNRSIPLYSRPHSIFVISLCISSLILIQFWWMNEWMQTRLQAQAAGVPYQNLSHTKCFFETNTVCCSNLIIPSSFHCFVGVCVECHTIILGIWFRLHYLIIIYWVYYLLISSSSDVTRYKMFSFMLPPPPASWRTIVCSTIFSI